MAPFSPALAVASSTAASQPFYQTNSRKLGGKVELLVFPFAILALLAGALIFFQLVKLLTNLAATTALGFAGVFFGFTLALLLDIKFITVSAAFLTYAFSIEGGRWGYYAAILSFYLFVVCSANIVVLMIETIRRTKLGAKLAILKPFSFDFDSLSEINKGLPDVLRMGVAFWGGLGLFIAFALLFFIASQWAPSSMFPGKRSSSLTFGESFGFALQMWCDAIPVVQTAANQQFSKLGASWDSWPSRVAMFVILTYQFLIYPAAFNFVAKLWEVIHAKHD